MSLIYGLCSADCKAQVGAPDVTKRKSQKQMNTLGLAAKLRMVKNGGDKLFYKPTKGEGRTPDKLGLVYEDVFFESADKTKLHGWFIPAKQGVKKAKGTIVFSHGNSGRVSYHLGFVSGMIARGYNLFLYDYRGFGQSEGVVQKEGIIADAVAAFRYIKTREDINQDKILSVSHSLGGAKSIAALAEYQPEGLCGIVVMNTFSSYRKIMLKLAGKATSHLISDTYNPVDLVKQLPKVPVLVIHAENDQLIPWEHGEEIFKAANQPKTMMKLKFGGHSNFLAVKNRENEKKLLKWLDFAVN